MATPASLATPALTLTRPTSSSSKRSRSTDSQRSTSATPVPEKPGEAQDMAIDQSLPAFLRQSDGQIHSKFEELFFQQQLRLLEGRQQNDPASKWAQEQTREVKNRNRYADISAWANSRIRLKVVEGACDYINASPISLHCSKTGKERKYIAAQGPKQTGINEFWQMVWHETKEVAVIVMLTQLAEGLREKCCQYYPETLEDGSLQLTLTRDTGEECLGQIKLDEVTIDDATKSTVRKLTLTCGEDSKIVWHFLFLGWPDYGVPENEDCEALLNLVRLSNNKNHTPENPRIVHCSAGVGRSGTFIALEHLLEELEVGSVAEVGDPEDMIFETVNRLREQRMTMVQSLEQFQFLYQLLRDHYRKKQKEQETTPASSADTTASEKSSLADNSEPSRKVMRLSRGIKAVFLRTTSRSRSRNKRAVEENKAEEGKAPES
ncbi:MAG: hypothetical protein MMC33_006224 [Icmadophila ericetorum]|nr:hypothetical protein [Icmadophila ericetorum]